MPLSDITPQVSRLGATGPKLSTPIPINSDGDSGKLTYERILSSFTKAHRKASIEFSAEEDKNHREALQMALLSAINAAQDGQKGSLSISPSELMRQAKEKIQEINLQFASHPSEEEPEVDTEEGSQEENDDAGPKNKHGVDVTIFSQKLSDKKFIYISSHDNSSAGYNECLAAFDEAIEKIQQAKSERAANDVVLAIDLEINFLERKHRKKLAPKQRATNGSSAVRERPLGQDKYGRATRVRVRITIPQPISFSLANTSIFQTPMKTPSKSTTLNSKKRNRDGEEFEEPAPPKRSKAASWTHLPALNDDAPFQATFIYAISYVGDNINAGLPLAWHGRTRKWLENLKDYVCKELNIAVDNGNIYMLEDETSTPTVSTPSVKGETSVVVGDVQDDVGAEGATFDSEAPTAKRGSQEL